MVETLDLLEVSLKGREGAHQFSLFFYSMARNEDVIAGSMGAILSKKTNSHTPRMTEQETGRNMGLLRLIGVSTTA